MNSETGLTPEPLVTIVVVPRERFSHTRRSLEMLYTNTAMPFRLIYVDGGSPAHVKRYLEKQAREKEFRLIRTERYLSPNQARNIGLREVDSKYVVFLDNDVEVAPGWLSALVRCAEETNASIVGPLYCIGQPLHQIIHMAGGEARIQEARGRRSLHETHRFYNKNVAEVRSQLRREACDLVEFHCALVRRQVFWELGELDEAMLGTREHVDLCLAIREAGGTVWLEPNAVVTQQAPPPVAWSDIPYYLLRWSDDWTTSTIRHFHHKWNLEGYDEELVRTWLRPHRQIALSGLRERLCRIAGARIGNGMVDALEWFMAREALRKGTTGTLLTKPGPDFRPTRRESISTP
jgi:GT2 family glycosyltransferase